MDYKLIFDRKEIPFEELHHHWEATKNDDDYNKIPALIWELIQKSFYPVKYINEQTKEQGIAFTSPLTQEEPVFFPIKDKNFDYAAFSLFFQRNADTLMKITQAKIEAYCINKAK